MAVQIDESGQTCLECRTFQPWANFHRRKNTRSGYRTRCKTCRSGEQSDYHAKQRKPRLTDRDALAKSLRTTVLTVDEFVTLNELSGGVCNVCGEASRSGKRLAVDHDHATGEFRGLLCLRCNTALGLADDSIDRLRALIAYLEAPPLTASAASPGWWRAARRG